MNWLLIGYAVIYGALAAGGIWSDIKSRYSVWLTSIDAAASIFGLAGLLLYHSATKVSWWGLAFIVICAGLVVAVIDIYDELKESPEDRKYVLWGGLLGIAVEIPCLVINYIVAFG